MTWEDVMKLVFAFIASVGGAGAIICAASKFLAEKIADRLQIKYQHELDAKLESVKSDLEHKNYVTKTQFDVEFKIYQKLSSTFFVMLTHLNAATKRTYYEGPEVLHSPQEIDEFHMKEGPYYKDCHKYYMKAQDTLYENAAFINPEIYALYKEILSLSFQRLSSFASRYDAYEAGLITMSKRLTVNDEQLMTELWDKNEKLNEKLQQYLYSLSVIK